MFSGIILSSCTNIDERRQWYFENLPDFKPEVGFETQFNVQSEERNFLHQWRVIEVIPLKKIVYNWKYEEYPGNSFVTWELSGQNNLTRLELTHQVTESFPQDIPEFARESGLEGWRFFIQKRLKDFLASE